MSKHTIFVEPNGSDAQRFPSFSAAPSLDPADYRADLADMNLSEAQETELLQILWSMMGSFARMGIEADVCGLIFEGFNEAADPASANAMLGHLTKETPSENDGNGGAP